jgi:Ser/Thr protein kinase RdoA (MazF antagonist)
VLYDGDHRHLPAERRARFIAAAAHVERAIDDLKARNEPMQVLHGDLHVWNVLKTRRGLAAIDFEDHMWGWPIQDLGVALYYLARRPNYRAMLDHFRAGYVRVRPWPERRPGELETFIAARTLVLANDVVLLEREGEAGLDADAFFVRADALLQRLLGGTPA